MGQKQELKDQKPESSVEHEIGRRFICQLLHHCVNASLLLYTQNNYNSWKVTLLLPCQATPPGSLITSGAEDTLYSTSPLATGGGSAHYDNWGRAVGFGAVLPQVDAAPLSPVTFSTQFKELSVDFVAYPTHAAQNNETVVQVRVVEQGVCSPNEYG